MIALLLSLALAALVAAVDAHPKVGEWKALHSKFYAPK